MCQSVSDNAALCPLPVGCECPWEFLCASAAHPQPHTHKTTSLWVGLENKKLLKIVGLHQRTKPGRVSGTEPPLLYPSWFFLFPCFFFFSVRAQILSKTKHEPELRVNPSDTEFLWKWRVTEFIEIA